MTTSTQRFVDHDDDIFRGNPEYPGHDELGFRNVIPIEAADVVIVGNSHTYGTMVRGEDSWPVILQRDYGRAVYSMALGGWSFYQYVTQLDRVIARPPHTLICTVFLGYDFYGTTNHYLKHPDQLAARFPGLSLGTPPDFNLRWRMEKENFVAKTMKDSGISQGEALRRARQLGYEDCLEYEAADGSHFFEVKLRGLITDPEHPWIAKGLEIGIASLELMVSATAGSQRRVVVVYPTKEYVFGSEFPDLVQQAPLFRTLLGAERELRHRFIAACEGLGLEVWDLADFFGGLCESGLYFVETRDSHYTPWGTERIAALVDARLG